MKHRIDMILAGWKKSLLLECMAWIGWSSMMTRNTLRLRVITIQSSQVQDTKALGRSYQCYPSLIQWPCEISFYPHLYTYGVQFFHESICPSNRHAQFPEPIQQTPSRPKIHKHFKNYEPQRQSRSQYYWDRLRTDCVSPSWLVKPGAEIESKRSTLQH